MSLHQFNMKQINILVPTLEDQKHVKLIKESLREFDGVLGVSCDRKSKLVSVTFSKHENTTEFSQKIMDFLERKGFKANQLQATLMQVPSVVAEPEVAVSSHKRAAKK